MRVACVLLLLTALLGACAPSAVPTPSTVSPAVATPVVPATAAPIATSTAGPPASPIPSPTPASLSGLPAYLRTLDLRVPAGNSYYPRALAFHPGLARLYARTSGRTWQDPPSVTALDAATGRVLAVAQTPREEAGSDELAVDSGRDRVYVVTRSEGAATVLDARTLDEVAALPDAYQVALDAQATLVAVAGPASVRLLDPEGYGVRAQATLPPDSTPFDLALDSASSRLYLAVQDAGGYSLLTYDLGLAALNSLRLPGQPEGLASNPARGEVYVTSADYTRDLLWTLDSDGRLLSERILGDTNRRTSLAVGSGGRRIFLGRQLYAGYAVEVVDLETGRQVTEIPLPAAPAALLWAEETGRLWAAFAGENRVAEIDVEAGRVQAAYPTAVGLTDVEVDPLRGALLVADTVDTLHVLDGLTGEERAHLPAGAQLAVDPVHGRYYSGGWQSPTVRIYDADRLEQAGEIPFSGTPVADAHAGGLYIVREGIHLVDLETLSVAGVLSDTLPQSPGYSPNPTAVDAAVDPGTGRIFAVISNGIPGSNGGTYLAVYEPVTFEKILEDRERSVVSIDIAPEDGQAYVSRVHLAGASTSLLVDGRTYAARVDSLYGGVRVDPGLGRAYVSNCGSEVCRLTVLDSTTLEVLDAVSIPLEYDLAALDPARHLLYLARDDGLVQVWSATGGEPSPPELPEPADLASAGPLRLVVPAAGETLFALDAVQRAYRSDDGGDSWGRVGGGLPQEMVTALAPSPGFAQDRTLFAAAGTGNQGYGIWKSTDAGDSWRLFSRGLTDLGVTNLVLSPAFAADHTLYASAHAGGLYRSRDAGATWLGLTTLYRPPDTYPSGPAQLLLSPAFGEEQTLLVEHYGFRRSDDGGDTWHTLADTGGGYFWRRFLLAPDYASSHVLYCFSISLEIGGGSYLLGSTDGGDTWADLGPGPVPARQGDGRLLVTPEGIAYLVWMPYYPETDPELFRSSRPWPAGGQPVALTWERYTGPPLRAATPLELSGDASALVALDAEARLLRWPLDGLAWQPAPPQTPMPSPTAGP